MIIRGWGFLLLTCRLVAAHSHTHPTSLKAGSRRSFSDPSRLALRSKGMDCGLLVGGHQRGDNSSVYVWSVQGEVTTLPLSAYRDAMSGELNLLHGTCSQSDAAWGVSNDFGLEWSENVRPDNRRKTVRWYKNRYLNWLTGTGTVNYWIIEYRYIEKKSVAE